MGRHTGQIGDQPLTDEQVEAYHRDGYLIVPGLYDAKRVRQWKASMQEALMAEPEKISSGVRVWFPSKDFPHALLGAMTDKLLTQILRQLIGPSIEFLSAKALIKDQETTLATPWHIDWFYWHGTPKTSIWIALDDATVENGCLRFVPGSHRLTFCEKHDDASQFNHRILDQELAGLPVETIACRRGDAVFFCDRLVHGSHPNTSGENRWALIPTYRNGSVNDDSSVWKTSIVVGG